MNYFAHGLHFVERPYFLAGTAVPDWLSVADRRSRMHSKRVRAFLEHAEGVEREIAAGVLQHLHDDDWFHCTRGFVEVSGLLTLKFREVLSGYDNIRSSVIGHIATEMLLDGCLMADAPRRLDEYYAAMSSVDPQPVQEVVNRMAKHPTQRLAVFIPLFQREQFLRDYIEPKRMLVRLNQVMSRIKLSPLPGAAEEVLRFGRELVGSRLDDLLPSNLFSATREAVPRQRIDTFPPLGTQNKGQAT